MRSQQGASSQYNQMCYHAKFLVFMFYSSAVLGDCDNTAL